MELEKVAQVATVLAAVVAVLEFLRRKRIKREEITYDERSDPSLDDESFSETLKMYRLCLRADAFVETFAFLWALPGIPIGLIVWNQTESFWEVWPPVEYLPDSYHYSDHTLQRRWSTLG